MEQWSPGSGGNQGSGRDGSEGSAGCLFFNCGPNDGSPDGSGEGSGFDPATDTDSGNSDGQGGFAPDSYDPTEDTGLGENGPGSDNNDTPTGPSGIIQKIVAPGIGLMLNTQMTAA